MSRRIALPALLALLGVWVGLALAPTALAQTVVDPVAQLSDGAQPLPPDAVRDLVSRLSDEDVRRVLIERLDATARSEANGDGLGGMVQDLQSVAHDVRRNLHAMLAAVVDVPGAMPAAVETLRDGRPYSVLAWIVGGFAIMLLVGAVAEWLLRMATRDLRQRLGAAQPDGILARFGLLGLRFGLDLFGLVVFAAAALATFFAAYHGHEMTRNAVMTYLAAVLAFRLYGSLSRFLLAPRAPSLRLANLSDSEAAYLHRQNLLLGAIAAFGFFSCSLLEALGIDPYVHQLLVTAVGAAVVAVIVQTNIAGREIIKADIRGPADAATRARAVVADVWPRLNVFYTVAIYIIVVMATLAGVTIGYLAALGSLAAVLFYPHIDALLERAARQRQSEIETGTVSELQIVALRASRIVLAIAGVLFLFSIWGINLFSLAQAGVGAQIAGALIDIGFTVLVAYVLWHLAQITIDRKLAEEEAANGGSSTLERGDEGGAGASRLSTLLPLIKRAIQITIGVIAVMLVLSAVGVDIGPLLAGAGVVGLAVGFGAQALVRDVVSGVFFLVDDAFRLGEYIDVGSVKGTVEKISIRSLRLRHHRGPLHTIPFGEIQHLTNFSRDWVIMKLEFRVTYDTDVRLVKKLFKQIGQDLLNDPELGPGFIEPFKSQGVKEMQDSAMIVRGKFMANPGDQFMIRKEIYTRVQRAFQEHGIQFAHRRVAVDLPAGVDPASPQGKALSDAAAAAAENAPDAAPSAAR